MTTCPWVSPAVVCILGNMSGYVLNYLSIIIEVLHGRRIQFIRDDMSTLSGL